jgi:phage recombination protein Bet
MSSEQALARVERGAVTERRRGDWSEEQINLIASTVAEGATRAQLMMFLELAATYNLDPFAREIWCAVPKNQDGSSRTDKVMIMVGRDGFLKIAQRHPDYEGMDADVVYANDKFQVESVEGKRLISHSYTQDRGAPVAAYCVVHRAGRRPTYFYAAMSDFRPNNPSAFSQWAKGPSTMILKCAEAGALRRAFSITGIVAEEEMGKALEAQAVLAAPEPDGPPELVERVRSLYDQARLFDSSAWTPAKERLQLAGASEDRLVELEGQLREFIVAHGGVVAETITDVVEEPDDESGVNQEAPEVTHEPTEVAQTADAATEPAEPLEREPDGPDYEPTEPQPEGVDDDGSPLEPEAAAPEPKGEVDAAAQVEDAPDDAVRKAAERAMRAAGVNLPTEDDKLAAEHEAVEDANREAEAFEQREQADMDELDFGNGGDDKS